jgi:hypothetical protein
MAVLLLVFVILGLCLSGCSKTDTVKTVFLDIRPEELKETQEWGTIPLNQIIIVLKDGEKASVAKQIAKRLGGTVAAQMQYLNLYQITFKTLDEDAFNKKLDEVKAMAGVELALPHMLSYPQEQQGVPCSPLRDPVFETEANRRPYEMIGMSEAWAVIRASGVKLSNVKVGVLDTALYTGSQEIGGSVKISGDTTDVPHKDPDGNIVSDGMGHGTQVTHVIGADADNAGVTGIASALGDKLSIEVKNLYDGLPLPDGASSVIKALVYLKEQVDSGAKVINCSYGARTPGTENMEANNLYRKFFQKMAKDHPDVVFVAAAGNEGAHLASWSYYPGGITESNVVTVGAVENDGSKASFSNSGEVTVSAPGVNVVVGVTADGKPITASGTSFAAPQVTAAIALMQSINPKLTAQEIKSLLISTAQKQITYNGSSREIPRAMGFGVLRVDDAVLAVINGLRQKENKEPLAKEDLLGLSSVNLTATGGGKKFAVKAVLPKVSEGSASVSITVTGQHSLQGSTSQTVAQNQAAVWDIQITESSVVVKVTREDTGACSYLTLTSTSGWKLVEVIDYDNKESWDLSKASGVWGFEYSCAAGSYGARIWDKAGSSGLSYGARAVWSAPPEEMRPGQKISLEVTLSETSNTHRWSTSVASSWADFAPPHRGLGARGDIGFAEVDGRTAVEINGAHKASDSATMTAIVPMGSEGQSIALRLQFYMGNTMGTYYVYKWE